LDRRAFAQAFDRLTRAPALKTARTRVFQLVNPTTQTTIEKLCKWLSLIASNADSIGFQAFLNQKMAIFSPPGKPGERWQLDFG